MPCRGEAVRVGCLGQRENRSDIREKAAAHDEFGHPMQVRGHQAREHRAGARISEVDGRRTARDLVSGHGPAREHAPADIDPTPPVARYPKRDSPGCTSRARVMAWYAVSPAGGSATAAFLRT